MTTPALEPIRERVLVGVAAVLATISQGAVYWTTPTSPIERALLSIDQYKARVQTGPILGVMRSTGSTLTLDERPAGFLGLYQFSVWGFVRETAGLPAGTLLERLWADHVIALLGELATETAGDPDHDLRYLVTDLAPGVCETDSGHLEPEAAFEQAWTARLHERYAAA